MKKDWTVWFWNGTYWEKASTYHAEWWVKPRQEAERFARKIRIERRHSRVLPAGREPKGRP